MIFYFLTPNSINLSHKLVLQRKAEDEYGFLSTYPFLERESLTMNLKKLKKLIHGSLLEIWLWSYFLTKLKKIPYLGKEYNIYSS